LITVKTLPDKLPVEIKPRTVMSRTSNYKYIPKEYLNIAAAQEAQYMEFMIKKMNKTIGKEEKQGGALDYYNSLLDTKRANEMAVRNRGNGLQKTILDQIYPNRLRNEITYNYYLAKEKKKFGIRSRVRMPAKKEIEIYNELDNLVKKVEISEVQSQKSGELL
jgi:hypothetical protein